MDCAEESENENKKEVEKGGRKGVTVLHFPFEFLGK